MNHWISFLVKHPSSSIYSTLLRKCPRQQIVVGRWIRHCLNPKVDRSGTRLSRVPVRLLPVSGRYLSLQDKDQDEFPIPKTDKKTISEKTRVMAFKTKEMSEKTRSRIRETRDVMKDKLEGIRENIFTFPNALSTMRIILTPVMGYCILHHHHVAALSIFLVAGITDLMDGYIARTFPSQKSVLGSLLDPVADKFLVATSFLTLTMDHLIPIPLTVLIISRDVILVACGVYIRYNSLPPPKTITKFFDFSMATAEMKPTFISKVNTVIQLSLICSTLASPIFINVIPHDFFQILWWTTAATTLFSGLGYLSMKGSYRVIRAKSKRQQKD